MITDYIVIVYSPNPTEDEQTEAFYAHGSVQANLQPAVMRVQAHSPEGAAEKAEVPAGGYVLVAEERKTRRFNRPKVAALQESRADGNPLPRLADAS